MRSSYLNIEVAGSQVKVNQAQIVESDFKAANGVVHIVDRIMLPPNLNLNPTGVRGRSQIASALKS
nr:fasciclin domain-containing protein [Chamaesiphon sp. OTE_75_metabat_556]